MDKKTVFDKKSGVLQEVKYVPEDETEKFENNQKLKPKSQNEQKPDTLFLIFSVILGKYKNKQLDRYIINFGDCDIITIPFK